MNKEIVLVGVKADLRRGESQMQRLARAFVDDHELIAISSLYSVSNYNEGWEDWDRGLAAVYKVRTELSAEDFLKYLHELENVSQKEGLRKVFQVYLLTHGNTVELSMKMNLPHPELHKKPELLVPSSEVYGEYQHPVLEGSLNSLAKKFSDRVWGEFYALGKVLLRNSGAETEIDQEKQ